MLSSCIVQVYSLFGVCLCVTVVPIMMPSSFLLCSLLLDRSSEEMDPELLSRAQERAKTGLFWKVLWSFVLRH